MTTGAAPAQAVEIEPIERGLASGLRSARGRPEECRTRREMHAQDDRDHREHEVEDEYVAVLPGVVLMLKEVHSHWAPALLELDLWRLALLRDLDLEKLRLFKAHRVRDNDIREFFPRDVIGRYSVVISLA